MCNRLHEKTAATGGLTFGEAVRVCRRISNFRLVHTNYVGSALICSLIWHSFSYSGSEANRRGDSAALFVDVLSFSLKNFGPCSACAYINPNRLVQCKPSWMLELSVTLRQESSAAQMMMNVASATLLQLFFRGWGTRLFAEAVFTTAIPETVQHGIIQWLRMTPDMNSLVVQ